MRQTRCVSTTTTGTAIPPLLFTQTGGVTNVGVAVALGTYDDVQNLQELTESTEIC